MNLPLYFSTADDREIFLQAASGSICCKSYRSLTVLTHPVPRVVGTSHLPEHPRGQHLHAPMLSELAQGVQTCPWQPIHTGAKQYIYSEWCELYKYSPVNPNYVYPQRSLSFTAFQLHLQSFNSSRQQRQQECKWGQETVDGVMFSGKKMYLYNLTKSLWRYHRTHCWSIPGCYKETLQIRVLTCRKQITNMSLLYNTENTDEYSVIT